MVSNPLTNQSINNQMNLNKLLYKKYSNIKEEFSLMKINSIIYEKNSRLNSKYKDFLIQDYLEEFLKKFYSTDESKEKLSKLSKHYKNYLKFFCKPCLNNLPNNKIIQKHCEDHAEVFYKTNYNKNNQPENKNSNLISKNIPVSMTRNSAQENFEIIFDTMVRESLAKEEDNSVSREETIESICKLIKENTNLRNENNVNEKQIQFDADVKKIIETRLKVIYKSDESNKLKNLCNLNYEWKGEKILKNNIGASACYNFWNKKRNSLIESEKVESKHEKKNLEKVMTDKLKNKINSKKESVRNFTSNEPLRGKNNLEQKYIPCIGEKNNFNKLLENIFKNGTNSNTLLLDKKNNILPDRKISLEKLSHQRKNRKEKSPEKTNSNQFRFNNKIKNYLNSSVITAVVFKEKLTLNKTKNTSSTQFNCSKNSNSSRFNININQSQNIKSKKLSSMHQDNTKIPVNIPVHKETDLKSQNKYQNKSCVNELTKFKSKTENNFFIRILKQNKTQVKIINDVKLNHKVLNKLEANSKNLYKSSARDNTNTIKKSNNKIYKEKSKEKTNSNRINEKIIPFKQIVKSQRYNSLG